MSTASVGRQQPDAWMLAGGGDAGALIRATDWAATPLGPIGSWSRSLKAIVAMIVHSRHPMFLWWGPELIQIYNDAYVPSFGIGKHPAAMGQRGRECWPEIWHIIGPQIERVMSHGIPSWHEDALVPIFRNGAIEDVYCICATGDPVPGISPVTALVTFHSGGTMSETAGGNGFAPGQRSPGHGTWHHESGQTFSQKFAALINFTTVPGFQEAGWQTVEQTVELSDRDTLSSTGTNRFFRADGTLYRSGCSRASGRRFE